MRSARLLLFSMLLLTMRGFAQYTYNHKTTISKGALALETNGINRPPGSDFISFTNTGFYVNVSDGTGGYYPPRFHAVPGGAVLGTTISGATGDFDRDGIVDLVVMNGSRDVYFYRGNLSSEGGYFDFPKAVTVATGTSGAYTITAADINLDGKLDIIFGADGDEMRAALGNGDGTFQESNWVWGVGGSDDGILVANFNGDTRADLATTHSDCQSFPTQCSTDVSILFGAAGGFIRPPKIVSFDRAIAFTRVVDIDSNGRSDLLGTSIDSLAPIVRIVKGEADGTFTVQDVGLVRNVVAGTIDAADLDGDGRKDLVLIESDSSSRYLVILYGQADGSFSPEEIVYSNANLRTAMTSRYNSGTIPDIAARTSGSESGDGTLHIFRNTHSYTDAQFPACDPLPETSSINVCSISVAPNTANVAFHIGSAFTSPLSKIELWVDGTKRAESFNSYDQYAFLDSTLAFSAGEHSASVYAVSFDGLNINKKTTFQVGSSKVCAALASPGINICSPGTTATSRVSVNATGKTANTTVRMELWIDNNRRASVAGSTLQTSVILEPGTHRFSFYAFDSSGSKINVVRNVGIN